MARPPASKTCAKAPRASPSHTCSITKVARSNNSSEGSTLYVTASPCLECSKLIIQAGIRRVVFNDLYRLSDGIDLLQRAGVECVHLSELNNE